MSRIPLRLSIVAVVCLSAGACLRSQDVEQVAPKYEYAESAPSSTEVKKVEVGQPSRRKVPEDAFARLDEDGDGALSVAEFVAQRSTPALIQQATDILAFSDLNGDGKLSREEFRSKPPRARFRQMDMDGDGGLSIQEFHEGEMASAVIAQVRRVFDLLDRDDDGAVSFEESQVKSQEYRHARMDENADSRLSLEEFEKGQKDLVAGGRSQQAFAALDRNGDAELTVEEFVKRAQEAEFLFRDRDSDHKLSLEEFGLWRPSPDPALIREQYEKKDTDADGLLTLREYSYDPADNDFWAMDRDNDARVSWEELAGTGSPATAAEPTDDRLPGLFAEIDQNGDKLIALEEFRARRDDLTFYCRDGDRDRRLNVEEFKGGFDDTPEAIAQAEKLFQFKDADADAKLTFDEYNSSPAKLRFWQMDADGDGALNVEELHQGDMPSATVEHARGVFGVLDGNDDARVTFEEWRATSQELRHATIDENGDRRLSLEEFEKGHMDLVAGGRSRPAFAAMDRNGDAELTVEEFVKRPQEAEFLFRDRDSDHKLSSEEFGLWRPSPDPALIREQYEKKDTDADGLLTLREYCYDPADNDFWAADENGDLGVDLDEFRKRTLVQGDEAAGAKLGEIFKKIDQNGDGRVSLAEFGWQADETRFQWFDLNQDGRLTQEEFVGNLENAGAIDRARNVFTNKDKDGSGSLSPEEFSGSGA